MGGPLQTKYRKEELDTSLGQEVKNPFFGVQTMETSLWAFAGGGGAQRLSRLVVHSVSSQEWSGAQ